MDLEKLSIADIRAAVEIAKALGWSPPGCGTKGKGVLPFKEGDALLIRTVTAAQVGRVRGIGRDSFVMEDGGWVASTGRFAQCLETGVLDEFERAPGWFGVGRGAIVDFFPWNHPLPKETK
jgi:hypothetical protein